MNDDDIQTRIAALIDREHQLRLRREANQLSEEAEHRELAAAEQELDQCWDLLRQRRAKREFGDDENEARARPASVVENYWQ